MVRIKEWLSGANLAAVLLILGFLLGSSVSIRRIAAFRDGILPVCDPQCSDDSDCIDQIGCNYTRCVENGSCEALAAPR